MRFINRQPGAGGRWLLALLPLILLVAVYAVASSVRLAENPDDKLLPGASSMVEAMRQLAFTEDERTGDVLLWSDTAASLQRLLLGIGVAAVVSLCLGIAAGTFPLLGATLSPLLAVVSMIPPLAILPILFIVFGLDELSKVMLIVIGITPVLARLFVSLQLMLGAAWLFLISAEAISATSGLGYRIFLVRRYLSMDIILPYVAWITLLAWAMDQGLKRLHRRVFPWSEGGAS